MHVIAATPVTARAILAAKDVVHHRHALLGCTAPTGEIDPCLDTVIVSPNTSGIHGFYTVFNYSTCAESCFDADYSYVTVPYMSEDQPRQIGLTYNSDRIAARPFIAADVSMLPNGPALQQFWLQAKVNWGSGWTTVVFMNGDSTLHFAANATQQVRLAGQFDASSFATGAYPLEIIVSAQYSTYVETHVDSTEKLLVVNERHSKYGQGWTITGLQRLFIQSDSSAVITDGDGSAQYFSSACSGCYTAPAGDFSQLMPHGSGGTRTYTRMAVDSSVSIFNNVGQLTKQISVLTRDTAFFAYDSLGRLASVSDPFRMRPTGTCVCHTVDTLIYLSGSQIRIEEPGPDGSTGTGRITLLTLNADSTLQSIQDPDSAMTRFLYDGSKRLSTVINRRGDSTKFAYRSDSSWKLQGKTLPLVPIDNGAGGTTSEAPVASYVAWQTISVPTATTVTVPFTPILTDSVLAKVTDPAGHSTHFTVDRWGQPLRIVQPFGLVTTVTRNGIFAVKRVRPTGAVDSAGYNSFGQLTLFATAGQSPTLILYGPYGLPSQVSGGGKAERAFAYGAGGKDSIVRVAGVPTRLYANAHDRDTLIVDTLGNATRHHYDPKFGNLDSTLAPGGRWTKVVFDGRGRDSLRAANGLSPDTTTYDTMNRVIRIASPGLGASTLSYDALFEKRLKDTKGNVYRVDVDALGRADKRYDPADTINRFTTYRYNVDGLLTSLTNRRGQRIDMAYDSLHRELAKSGPTNVVTDSFSYNPTGTITAGANVFSRDSVFISSVGWTDSVVTHLLPSNKRFRRYYHPTQAFQLDSVGIQTSSGITFANRHFSYDPSTGLLDTIRTSNGPTAVTFTAEFLDSTLTWPGNVVETIGHTSRNEVSSTAFNVDAIGGAFSRTYGYADSLGHIGEIGRPFFPHGEERTYTYDQPGRLSVFAVDSETQANACTPPSGQNFYNDGTVCQNFTDYVPTKLLAFRYDSASNLVEVRDSIHHTSTSATYGAGNRLAGWNGAVYTTDRDGDDSTKTVGSEKTTYGWTADGRLASVSIDSVTLNYGYNALGQLVQRSRTIGHGSPVIERKFLWDNNQLLAELDGSDTLRIAEYIYWPGIDDPFAIVTGSKSITATRYFSLDEVGNVNGIFSATNAAQTLTYLPFGVVDSAYSAFGTVTDTNRLRWKGLIWEGDSTRLYYMRNRWYDPQSGRFLSEDPTGQAGGVNLYTFAGNDPINGADPFGTCKDGETRLRMEQQEDGTWVEICKDSNGDEVPETYTGISPVSVTGDQGELLAAMLNGEVEAANELDAFMQEVEQNAFPTTTCIDLNCQPFNDPGQMAAMKVEAAALQAVVQSCVGKKLSNRNDWVGSAVGGAAWAAVVAWKVSEAIDPAQFVAGTVFTQVVGSGVSCSLGG